MRLRVTDPLVAWLTYRGVLQSIDGAAPEFMSIWASKASSASISPSTRSFYEREYHLEIARRTANPAAVSRLTGLFVFPTRADADRAVDEWDGFEEYFLNEVQIQPGSRVSIYDADWIMSAGRCLDAGASRAYVIGAPRTTSPHAELWPFAAMFTSPLTAQQAGHPQRTPRVQVLGSAPACASLPAVSVSRGASRSQRDVDFSLGLL